MASGSASTNLTANSGGRFYVSVYWNETSTSTANNTSTISVTGTLGQSASSETFWSGNIKAGQLSIYWHDNNAGTDQWIDNLNIWEIGYDQSSRSITGSITVSHKADGTLTGYAFATWTKDPNGTPYYAPNSGRAETGWVNLTTIPRKVEISSVTGSFTDEDLSPTVKWTNNGNRVDLKLELPSLGLNPWKRWNNLQGASSYSPTFTQTDIDDLLSRMPNSSTLNMRFTVTTVINGTDSFFSYLDKTFTIVNGEPVFTDFTYADTNATTTAITGDSSVMISGKSTLAATISSANKAVAQKSATMSKYTFAVADLYADENYSASAITKTLGSPTIASTELPSGTRDLTVTAIDSRSLSTPVVKTITIVPYDSPMINATAARVNGFENDTILKISGKFSRIEVNGTAKNTVNSSSGVKYRYKAQSTSTWGSWTNKSVTVDTATGTITATDITLSLNNQESYDIEVQMTDKLETTTVGLVVSVGQPAFFIGADGRVSVGEMPQQTKLGTEKGILEVDGRAFANGNRLLEDKAGVIQKTNMAASSVGLSAIDNSEMGTLVWAGYAGFNKRAYNNGYIVLENLTVLLAAPGCSGVINSNTLRIDFTLPTSGSYYAEVYGQLWTNGNSWDYIILGARKNLAQFGRAMAPRPNGSWGFVELTHPVTIANGDHIEWHLNTNGNNFSDGNMSIADSYTYIKIYKIGN